MLSTVNADADLFATEADFLALHPLLEVDLEYNLRRNRVTLGRTQPLSNGWDWTLTYFDQGDFAFPER